ncbi:MAG: hypothetical protein AB7D47_06805 [Desulfovibrio sp.]
MGSSLLFMVLFVLAACAPLLGDPDGLGGCEYESWQDVAEILSVNPVGADGAVLLGGHARGLQYMVEFRIAGVDAPENSAVRRRTTPFVLTMGAGGLPDQDYLDRYGIHAGARLPVRVSEGVSREAGSRCRGVRIEFLRSEPAPDEAL